MIHVLVVDDHTIFRSGVRRLLLDEADMRVAAAASSGPRADSTSVPWRPNKCRTSSAAKTVNTHRMNLLEKLGVASTAELVLYAVRRGLVH